MVEVQSLDTLSVTGLEFYFWKGVAIKSNLDLQRNGTSIVHFGSLWMRPMVQNAKLQLNKLRRGSSTLSGLSPKM